MHRTRSRTGTRLRVRKSLALFTGALLAAATLTLGGTPTTAAAHEEPAPAPASEDFQQVTLAKGAAETGEPMTLAVLPDRSVLHTSRTGELRLTDSSGNTSVAGTVPVYSHDEEGLQGVGIDPDFAENRAIYLYYAPPMDTPDGDAPETGTAADFAKFDGVNRLSRFVLKEDGTLDLGSEKKVLDVKTSRGICCHVGGDIDFDADGNLYLSTGDDSNPFASDGYSPLDARPDRNPAFDARRSALQQQRPARQDPPDQGGRRRLVHRPGRQPLRPGHGQDPPRDLRHGLPQPVPLQRRQGHRHRLRRRLRSGRGRGRPQARTGRTGRVRPGHQGRQLRLAVLHG